MEKIKWNKNKRMQKVLFLVFFACCMVFPGMQVHAESLLIQLSQHSVKAGDTLTVTVMVPPGVSTKVYLNYSPDVFKYVSSEGTADEDTGVVSVQADASAGTRKAVAIKFQAVSAGSGSFVASAEDSENISGASVVVNVAENPDAEAVLPEPEPGPEETAGDTQTETETQTGQTETPEENKYYELDGEKLYPSVLIPPDSIPEGFKEGQITLWGESYPYLYKKGGSKKICLLYLVDENRENGALYMVEKSAPYEVYPFVCVDHGTYKMQDVSAVPEGKGDNGTEDIEKLKSQNRLIFCAFIVVVLVLLIIIVILMIKRGDDGWEDMEKPLPKEERKKPDPKKKTELKQSPQPKKKPQPERKTEVKKKKKSAFWDAMFAGIDDDLSLDGFAEEEPEETKKKEKPKKESPKREAPGKETKKKEVPEKKQEPPQKKQRKPDEENGSDEDIEFIDL